MTLAVDVIAQAIRKNLRHDGLPVLGAGEAAERIVSELHGAGYVIVKDGANEIAFLRAALKPFAAYADRYYVAPDNLPISTGSPLAKTQITMGDCYRAAAALSETR